MSQTDWLSGEWCDDDTGLWTDYDDFIWYPDTSGIGGMFVARSRQYNFTSMSRQYNFITRKRQYNFKASSKQ